MNIVYAVNDGFCQHMAVSIFSLIEHNHNEDLHFHILSDGISENNQYLIRQMIEDEGKEVDFYPLELSDELKSRLYRFDTGKFRITILARLLMGSILPETVTKAMYIDADTVILRPLHKLYALRLGEHIAAMAAEPTIYPEVKNYLGIPEEEAYFNSGVMLINLSLWREEGIEDNCFSYYNKMGGKLPFADQDILNAVLRKRVIRLPQRYNFFSNYYYFRYSTLCKIAEYYGKGETKESFFVAKHHPVVLHYAGAERPWIQGNRNHYKRAYLRYLRKTPFTAMKMEKGNPFSLFAYHMMNVLTFIIPASRKKLSQWYYERNVRNMLEH